MHKIIHHAIIDCIVNTLVNMAGSAPNLWVLRAWCVCVRVNFTMWILIISLSDAWPLVIQYFPQKWTNQTKFPMLINSIDENANKIALQTQNTIWFYIYRHEMEICLSLKTSISFNDIVKVYKKCIPQTQKYHLKFSKIFHSVSEFLRFRICPKLSM